MKNLVVYYSRTTNTETLAKEIAKELEGDIKKIELKKEISFSWAAFSALLGWQGKIRPLDFDLKNYDNIFIGSPVWAGKTSTPINTFLNQADFSGKNVYVFVSQGDDKVPDKVFDSVKARVEAKGGRVIDQIFVQTDMKNPLTGDQARTSLVDWIKKINLI